MRISDFWLRLDSAFTQGHAQHVYRTHILWMLGNRTADQAIEAGEDPRIVWESLCQEFDLDEDEHYPQ